MQRPTRLLAAPLLALSTISPSPAAAAPVNSQGAIVYSARYYLKPGSKGSSYYKLYSIRPDGTGKRALTTGARNDWAPTFSPDRRRIAFIRADRWLCTIKPDGSGLKNLYDNKEAGLYNLRWSPDGKTLGYITSRSDTSGILFVDTTTGKTRWQRDANYFEWSPNGRYLAIERNNTRTTLIDLATRRETQLPSGTIRPAWLSNTDVVTVLTHMEDEFTHFDKFAIYTTKGALRRQLPITANPGKDYDVNSIDPRSRLKRIPGASTAFLFVWDDSTSSGPNALYHRIDSHSGASRHLVDGQSFALSPNGNTIAYAPYYDTTPYDTLPNGHKRVVYTSPLIVTDGKTKRTIVTGIVHVSSCDWR